MLISTHALLAINTPITGIVLDAISNEPLPFANVVIMGQGRGTVSNIEGYFVLNSESISSSDSLAFSYVGYEVLKIKVGDIDEGTLEVKLQQATVGLNEIQVFSKQLTTKDIIERIEDNYASNYPQLSTKQKVFMHNYENVPFKGKNNLRVKSSDFIGLDEHLLEDIIGKIPDEFTEYQDAVLELYTHDEEYKILPKEAISIEENDIAELGKEIEEMLSDFLNDIEETTKDEEMYYKFRTGIFSTKMEPSGEHDSIWNEQKKDSLNYLVPMSLIKHELSYLFKDYGDLEGDNWDFITNSGKYNYELGDVTILNDQLVYSISFKPKGRGLYEGKMYVTTDTYAILQLDYSYAPGKDSENIQLLGFGHSMNYKKCRVIYEKGQGGYFLKYINVNQNESASIDRDFAIIKKKERFLIDKELNEIKMEAHIEFDSDVYWEVLVLERSEITKTEFDQITEPKAIKFKKKLSYDSEIWNNNTVIAPTSELSNYQRQK